MMQQNQLTNLPPSLNQQAILQIEGMHCAGCVAKVERLVAANPAVQAVSVNLASGRAYVSHDGGDVAAICDHLQGAGYGASIIPDEITTPEQDIERATPTSAVARLAQHWPAVLGVTAALPILLLMPADMLRGSATLNPWVQAILAGITQCLIGGPFYMRAWQALRQRSATMDHLVVLGTSSAYGYSLALLLSGGHGHFYFEASAAILLFLSLGRFLEARAKKSTGSALQQLLALRPEKARWIDPKTGQYQERPLAAIAVGDHLRLLPGDRVPVDGKIIAGIGECDEALLTGEALPVTKQLGDKVLAGSVNQASSMDIVVEAIGAQSTLGRVARILELAQAQKPAIQRLVDQVSAIFVPVVMGVALLTGLVWLVLLGNADMAVKASLSVLIIACPCALGLATPSAIIAGMGVAAKHGILFRHLDALEGLATISDVAFDKTGTLTLGKPSLRDVVWAGAGILASGEQQHLLNHCYSLQQHSEHLLAKALVAYGKEQGCQQLAVANVTIVPGQGIIGQVAGARLVIGNQRLIEAENISTAVIDAAIAKFTHSDNPAMVSFAALDGRLVAVFRFHDPLHPNAASLIAALRARNIAIHLLSGDRHATVVALAHEIDIQQAYGDLLPEGKIAQIAALQQQGKRVAMLGDGINDSPALAQADIGIAMGGGSDIAMQAAGVVLMRPDPALLVAAYDIARATRKKLWHNLFWAFVYNVVGVPIAAAGYLNPALAGMAMAFSSVSVVANALLLTRWRPGA